MAATGTADPLADTRTQNTIELPENSMIPPEGDWDLIHGKLMTLANPGFYLPPIDRLEAFNPNGRCVYTRVLVALETSDLIRPVWLYNYKLGHNIERIASGCWYPAEYNEIGLNRQRIFDIRRSSQYVCKMI